MEATINGRKVTWQEAGGGDSVILFVHGFPLDARMWAPQLAALPPGWRGLAPDLRGFGASGGAGTAEAVSMDDYARDLIALLDHLNIARAVVCGLSMGGYVSFALSRLEPQRIRALVLADTRAGADSAEAKNARQALAARVLKEGAGAVVDDMMPKMVSAHTRTEQPDVVVKLKTMMESTSRETMAAALRGMADRPDSHASLRDIAVPTLVIVGEDDVITDRGEAQLLARAIRGAQIEVIPAAGHVSNLEQPAAFNAALRRFLADVPPG